MTEQLKFLVIEDDPADYLLIERHLHGHGMSVVCRRVNTRSSLEAALEREDWDAVLSDCRLRDMTFDQVLGYLHANRPDLPLVLVSGSVGEDEAVEMLKRGVWDFVLKDRLARLVPALERSLREARERRTRRALEGALRSSEQRLQLALDAARVVAWDWDLVSDAVTESGPVAALFGRAEGFSHRDLQELAANIHPDDREQVFATARAAAEGGDVYQAEYRILLPDGGERWVMATGDVLCDDSGRPVRMLGIARDITEQRRADDALREASRRKDQFLAVLGHELRNPLAPIRNAAELLRLNPGMGEEQVTWAADILIRQVDYVTRLVDDLMDVSRITRGCVELHKVPCDLREAARHALEQARPLLEKQRQRVEVSLPAEPLMLDGDLVRLGQVIGNLLNNAARYSEAEGTVALDLRTEEDSAVLRVSDTGMGIDANLLPHVFELFAQAEQTPGRPGGGLGLGLTLVKSLVEMHGGTVRAESPGPGQGSVFTVRLPRSLAGTPAETETPTRTGAGKRVLVVDDIAEVAETSAMLLRAMGHQVHVALDGEGALAATERLHPDLILLDIGLPGMDGFEVARCLRRGEAGRRARLVAVTGYGQDDVAVRTREAGFDGHLLKPVGLRALTAELEADGPAVVTAD